MSQIQLELFPEDTQNEVWHMRESTATLPETKSGFLRISVPGVGTVVLDQNLQVLLLE